MKKRKLESGEARGGGKGAGRDSETATSGGPKKKRRRSAGEEVAEESESTYLHSVMHKLLEARFGYVRV